MISETINDQIKDALKKGDSLRASTLRLLSSALHNEKIAKQEELSEEDEVAVVRRQVKQREESIEAYEKAGRSEQADKEKEELKILKEFLPKQMDQKELEKIVGETIEEVGASSMQDVGKVMGSVMQKVQGKADGGTVSAIVRKKLGE